MPSTLIVNGRLATARDVFTGDILIMDGRISAIRRAGTEWSAPPPTGAAVIDASGLFVLPGGVDPHVHMSLPTGGGFISSDDFDTGTAAALAGGVTTIIDFVTPERGGNIPAALARRRAEAATARCDYSFHMSITEITPNLPAHLAFCAEKEGIPSFKLYMAYKSSIGLCDRDLLTALENIASVRGLALVHCENGDVIDWLRDSFKSARQTAPAFHPLSRPPETEIDAVERAIWFSALTGCPLYAVHLSTAPAIAAMRKARRSGQLVFAETCPHYLFFNDSLYNLPGFSGAAYIMSPPLRPGEHQEALWRGLADGSIQVVATDHCPFTMSDREKAGLNDFTQIPGGVAGIEHRIPLLYTFGVAAGRITLEKLVELCCESPARIFGLYPRKGTLEPGADADLAIWDFNARSAITTLNMRQNCDYSIYEGFRLNARLHRVLLRGETLFHDGQLLHGKGSGIFIPRTPGLQSVCLNPIS